MADDRICLISDKILLPGRNYDLRVIGMSLAGSMNLLSCRNVVRNANADRLLQVCRSYEVLKEQFTWSIGLQCLQLNEKRARLVVHEVLLTTTIL